MLEDPPASQIPGLGKLSIELLDAIGIEKSSQLARANVDVLHLDLTKANKMLSIRKSSPSPKEISKWIENSREITSIDEGEETTELDEIAKLDEILLAIPVPGKRLAQQGIKASDVPVMATLSSGTSPKRKTAVSKPEVKSKPTSIPRVEAASENLPVAAPSAPLISKKNPLALPEEKPGIAPLESSKKNDVRVTASSDLNEGKKLHSRSFIRGVLHPQIGRMRISAILTILMFIMMPVSVASAVMIMLTKNLIWVIAPASFIIILFFYGTVAGSAKCRICGQPVFNTKNCRKHVKAHRIWGFGYILPTSLHMILFHWFRCTYCGTSVRLKK